MFTERFQTLSEANSSLRQGDLLLWKAGCKPASFLIGVFGRAGISHAAQVKGRPSRWQIQEVVQWHGGQVRPFDEAIRQEPGRILWYAANAGGRWPEWSPTLAVREFDRLIGCRYGWWNLPRVGLLHFPLFRLLLGCVLIRQATDDRAGEGPAPVLLAGRGHRRPGRRRRSRPAPGRRLHRAGRPGPVAVLPIPGHAGARGDDGVTEIANCKMTNANCKSKSDDDPTRILPFTFCILQFAFFTLHSALCLWNRSQTTMNHPPSPFRLPPFLRLIAASCLLPAAFCLLPADSPAQCPGGNCPILLTPSPPHAFTPSSPPPASRRRRPPPRPPPLARRRSGIMPRRWALTAASCGSKATSASAARSSAPASASNGATIRRSSPPATWPGAARKSASGSPPRTAGRRPGWSRSTTPGTWPYSCFPTPTPPS